ncbi:60S ribosomal protein l3 [Niveomyces insectorum RCEF 264]|uniref:60S ribosomal protein l3 n=1 Tax=Niveomyces insectorum RCEF 264 TaxID=1081102 RepID=A0A167VFR9_9HYPO|nr:60S ribosomal protein l3 [Niveomyces insectorum RCEF 264]
MKRIRVQRLAGQLLAPGAARPPATAGLLSACSSSASSSSCFPLAALPSSQPSSSASPSSFSLARCQPVRRQSTTSSSAVQSAPPPPPPAAPAADDTPYFPTATPFIPPTTGNTAPGLGPSTDPRFPELDPVAASSPAYPSPLPARARTSAKLAALHARLGLSQRLPQETLARTLVDASADPSPRFNNANLAYLGSTLIHYHTSEWLLCRYPRLPMVILYAAMKAYAGPQALADIARQWGVEAAAAPGAEVDPGLLQYSLVRSRQVIRRWGYQRAEAPHLKNPGEHVRVPSDMLREGAAPWEPAYVDIGEIL